MGSYLKYADTATFQEVSITFDVIISETHEIVSKVTEHPVEEGVTITDHVRPEVDKIKLTVFISNTPIEGGATRGVDLPLDAYQTFGVPPPPPVQFLPTPGAINRAVTRAIEGAPSVATRANVMTFDKETDFVKERLTLLRNVKDKAILVSLFTPKWLYNDMLLEEISMSRSEDTGTGAELTLSFRQIRIVAAKTIAAPKPRDLRGNLKKPAGKVATKDPPPEKAQSLLSKGLGLGRALRF